MIVVDASVLVRVLVQGGSAGEAARSAVASGPLHAPQLVDVEVASAVRRGLLRGDLDEDRAAEVLRELLLAPVERHDLGPLLPRAWELRHSLSTYDATYVALAETLGARLLTSDRGMATAHGPTCSRELVRAGAAG